MTKYREKPTIVQARQAKKKEVVWGPNGWQTEVEPGDWIVYYRSGYRGVYSDASFRLLFEEVNDG